jgi:hypothetical protein
MPCPKCNSTNIEQRKQGPHVGEYCKNCGKWLRWLPQYTNIENFIWPLGTKHKGKTIGSIIKTDPAYLQWAADNIRSQNLKRKATEILIKYKLRDPEIEKPYPSMMTTDHPGIKQCGHLKHTELVGGICYLCDRVLYPTCSQLEYSVHPDFETNGYPRLITHIREILYHRKPEIRSRSLIILCQPCITEIEIEFMNSYQYEDLPLLINHTWYGAEETYKYRLSGKSL